MTTKLEDSLWRELDWLLNQTHSAPWELSSLMMRLAHERTVAKALDRLTDPQLVILLRHFPPENRTVDPQEILTSNPAAPRLLPVGDAYCLLCSRMHDLATARPDLLAEALRNEPTVGIEARGVRLCEEDGLTPAQAATQLGVSEARVKRWLARAVRKRLRDAP